MERNKYLKTVLFLIILVFSFSNIQLQAQEKKGNKEYIKLEVDGLACPFCAYGLEKKLRNDIKDLDNLYINIQKGFVTFGFSKLNKPSEDKLKEIVSDAGFQAKKIYFSDKPFSNGEAKK
ncbi:hypothetical protein BMS3Abin04_02069 [bacterium BMS3Abin04]|nr:hypothetical protein BMS3Abin04_02069 [bacterium BMS3Abin04]